MLLIMKRLLRRPAYAVTMITVLGAGLGAALALYGVSDAVLFRPLPVADGERLVRLFTTDEKRGALNNWSLPDAREYVENRELFESVAWYADWMTYSVEEADGSVISLQGAVVSGNYFNLLGVQPVLGRMLQPGDDVRGSALVTVISHELWQSRFNGDADVVGRVLRLNDRVVTIVGVTSRAFGGVSLTTYPDVWLPVSSGAAMGMGTFDEDFLLTQLHWLDVVARLKPHVTLERAKAAFDVVTIADGEPMRHVAVFAARDIAVMMHGGKAIWRIAWLLLALVALVVLVACAAAAGLMLVRVEAQRGETAVRYGLGASRARVLCDIGIEATVLGMLAGALGFAFADVLARGLHAVLNTDLPLPRDGFSLLEPRVSTVYALLVLAVIVMTSMAALWRTARMPLTGSLATAGRRETQRMGVRELLVALQAGVSVIMVACALMFADALRDTLAIEPGFAVEDRVTARVHARSGGVPDYNDVIARYLDDLQQDPRIHHAALTGSMPVMNFGFSFPAALSSAAETVDVEVNAVSDGYFETLGLSLLEGRDLPADLANASVAVVTEAFARKHWPGRSALGQTVAGLGDRPLEIIGVVANHKQRELREDPRAVLFAPYPLLRFNTLSVVASGESAAHVAQALREHGHTYQRDLRIESVETVQERIDRGTARDRAMTLLAAIAAVFATALALSGMFAVAAFAMHQRQREVGIRYALGATRARVVTRYLRRHVAIAGGGVALGIAGAWIGMREASVVVTGARFDVGTLLIAALSLLAVAALAAFIPVWRTSLLAPMQVLRDE